MKVGIILPIGNIEKYGYIHNSRIIINNLLKFSDHIVVLSSSRNTSFQSLPEFKRVKFISNTSTWFPIINNTEIFDIKTLNKNVNFGKDILKKTGCDAAMEIHLNQYIPKNSFENIKNSVYAMLQKKENFVWLYKKYQLQDIIFHADKKLPWILNLNTKNPYEFAADSIKNAINGEIIRIKTGNFRKYDNAAIVDVIGEFSLKDAEEKYEFTISELLKLTKSDRYTNQNNVKFNKKEFLDYHQNKINNKIASTEKIDEVGQMIIKNSQPNYISNLFKKNYSPVAGQNNLKKIIGRLLKNTFKN